MKIRISLRIENRERYVIYLDKSLYKTPKDFIKFICQKFILTEKPNYVLLLEPDSIIYDIDVIEKNDKCRLIERLHLDKIHQDEENVKQKAVEDRDKLMKSGQWKPLNYTQSQYGYGQKGQSYQINPFYQPRPTPGTIYGRPSQGYNYYDSERDTRLAIPVKKAIKLPDKVDFEDMQNNLLQLVTPDFEEFSSGVLNVSNRVELNQTVKILAMTKGFRIVIPYSKQESKVKYLCHRTGGKKGMSNSKRTNCPFEVTFSKVERKLNYFLLKYRNYHNHPLEELDMFAGKLVVEKIRRIADELKKCKLNNLLSWEDATNDSSYEQKTKAIAGWLNTTGLSSESLEVLNLDNENQCNTRDIQIDAICKSLTYWYIEKGDVVDPETEGEPSTLHTTGVLLNCRDYENIPKEGMRTRRLILEATK